MPLAYAIVMLLLFPGCGREATLGDGYPDPFYGQLLIGDSLLAPQPQMVSGRVYEDSAFE